MSDYIDEGLSKGQQAESTAQAVLTQRNNLGDSELHHGAWIAKARSELDLTTAVDAAAGSVFAIVRPGQSYLLRADHSATTLSDVGTTVTLTGRYKN